MAGSSEDLPWWSALAWWQKVLATITLFIAMLTLLLLPKQQFAIVIFAGTGLNIAAGFWRGFRNRGKP
ncbi:MAG TPA: hypothetical protein VN876_00295 [Gemmatimonadaceae bacterium]|jgi:hypothetical protein|nr:hypothetical protein [Gemmatimonadaceae bacterium]